VALACGLAFRLRFGLAWRAALAGAVSPPMTPAARCRVSISLWSLVIWVCLAAMALVISLKSPPSNRVTCEVKEAAAALDDPVYRQKLASDLRERKVAPAIEQMLWYYAFGKPKEVLEVTATAPVSDEEFAARVKALQQGDAE